MAVEFAGARSPAARLEIALGGVARTFQNVQLFGEMTATENVLVGLHTPSKQCARRDAQTPRYKREEQARASAPPASWNLSAWPTWPTRRRATCRTASSACWKSAARWV
jgi:ABC-type branched-subunit amino acid transport system ATPase component